MCGPHLVATSAEPASDGCRTYFAHAEIAQPDECSNSSRTERHNGLSGLAILDAILAGESDCVRLAQLCHSSVKSPGDKIAQALEGDYRSEHLFVLQQSLKGYRYYQ